jgi:hypothetical protein
MVSMSDPKALQERLTELVADKEFVKELVDMEKVEDVQATLEAKGVRYEKTTYGGGAK